jgi:hypothetical protein
MAKAAVLTTQMPIYLYLYPPSVGLPAVDGVGGAGWTGGSAGGAGGTVGTTSAADIQGGAPITGEPGGSSAQGNGTGGGGGGGAGAFLTDIGTVTSTVTVTGGNGGTAAIRPGVLRAAAAAVAGPD